MKPVIIDTDPGIDDVAAILLALASSELEVLALTTVYGNSSVDACTGNALHLLKTAGRTDIPVYRGAGKPLLRPANEGWAAHIHGFDGLGEYPARRRLPACPLRLRQNTPRWRWWKR